MSVRVIAAAMSFRCSVRRLFSSECAHDRCVSSKMNISHACEISWVIVLAAGQAVRLRGRKLLLQDGPQGSPSYRPPVQKIAGEKLTSVPSSSTVSVSAAGAHPGE